MNKFKRNGGFRPGGGNPRTQRAEQSPYGGNPRTQRAEQSPYGGNPRTQRAEQSPYGGNSDGRPSFGGNNRFGGNKFGGGRDGGHRSERPVQLFPAVCSECKRNCEVPFRPTGDKPVYCRDCFGKQRQVPGRNSNGADGNPRTQRAEQSSYDGNPRTQRAEQSSYDGPRLDFRPDFRRDAVPRRENHFEPARPQNNEGIDALKRQLDSLESKVDRILGLVSQKPEPPRVALVAKEAPQPAKTAKTKSPAGKTATKGKK